MKGVNNIDNRVTKILNTKYPLIQAPMFWLTDAKFVAEVSNQGGLGIIGMNAGQDEMITDPDQQLDRTREEIRRTKELTSNSFGINIALLGPLNEGITNTINMALDEGVKYFAISGNVDQKAFDLIKQRDGIVIFRPNTPTVKSAQAAEQAGADIIVATGYDEGGLLPDRPVGTFSIVPEIVNAVDIPVIAAGGIVDNKTVNAVMELGAEGIYTGTRFIVADENRVAPEAKDLIVDASGDDVEFVSKTQRAISHPKADELNKMYNDPKVDSADLDTKINQDNLLKIGMIDGDVNKGIVSTDTAIGSISKRGPVKEIINDLFE